MVANRERADEKARDAIEMVEVAIREALGGETLRGLPDLGDRVFGLRVGVDGSAHARIPPKRPVLVLEAKGLLVLATISEKGTAFYQKAPRSMLKASLLVPYMRAVGTALRIHLEAAEKRAAEFARVVDLSGRVAAVLA
jgi:hypothetical protein